MFSIIRNNQISGEALRLAYFLGYDMLCTKCLCMDLLWRGTFPASTVCRLPSLSSQVSVPQCLTLQGIIRCPTFQVITPQQVGESDFSQRWILKKTVPFPECTLTLGTPRFPKESHLTFIKAREEMSSSFTYSPALLALHPYCNHEGLELSLELSSKYLCYYKSRIW